MSGELKDLGDIKNKIYTIRGKQVMLDRDLAELYDVKVKRLNEQVKRNIERYVHLLRAFGTLWIKFKAFPEEFCFKLDDKEFDILRSQFATSSWGGRRYLPYVFTEQGVAMLSTVLKSDTAIKVSIQIMKAFVTMRRFLYENASVFSRLENVEKKQIKDKIETDQNFEKVFNLIQQKEIKPEKGIFFDGSVFDAHKFVVDLISSAKSSIVLIDNYIDTSVLTLISHKRKDVDVKIFTRSVTEKLKLSKEKFNKQYGKLELIEFRKAHDRFLIIDEKEVYHIGASLKDLGKKWFAFGRFQKEGLKVLDKF